MWQTHFSVFLDNLGTKPMPFAIIQISVANLDLNSTSWSKKYLTTTGLEAHAATTCNFQRSQKQTWKTIPIEASMSALHSYGQFSWIVACSARCINRLHRRINACGSADYSATWHRNRIDIGGLKMDSCFFLLIMLWSRHVKPSSAKGEKRLKRKKISKFVQAEALPESESYKSKDRCTGKRDRITRDRETQRYAKTYQKPSPQTSVELRKKVASGSTIADSEAA